MHELASQSVPDVSLFWVPVESSWGLHDHPIFVCILYLGLQSLPLSLYQCWTYITDLLSWPDSAGSVHFLTVNTPDSPLWSLQHCTPCLGSSRTEACPWCRGLSGRRIRACWRAGACSCQNRPFPSGSAGHFPPPGVGPGSHTWTGSSLELVHVVMR